MIYEKSPVYKKHKNCDTKIVLGPFGPHYAKLICKKHGVQLQWLSKSAVALLEVPID